MEANEAVDRKPSESVYESTNVLSNIRCFGRPSKTRKTYRAHLILRRHDGGRSETMTQSIR